MGETSDRVAARAAAKEEAAKTMAADAKKAEKAKQKALAQAPTVEGQLDFLTEARRIEELINSEGYGTNTEQEG